MQRISDCIAQPQTEQLLTPVPLTQGSGDTAEEGAEKLYESQFGCEDLSVTVVFWP